MAKGVATEPAAFLKEHKNDLQLYDRMTRAIAECERIDEVKEIRNRARAMEVYAAQALNYEAEIKATKIRLRAERRCGELLKQTKEKGERQTGAMPGPGRGNKGVASHDTFSLADLGITRDQSSKWQRMAEVPEEEFEARLNERGGTIKPSTAELIREEPYRIETEMNEETLFVWGRICDFERHKCFELDPRVTFNLMLETMQDDILRICPQLIDWLTKLSRGGKS